MPIYQFKCNKCKKKFDTRFMLDKDTWYRYDEEKDKKVKLSVDKDDAPETAPCTNKKCKNRKAPREFFSPGEPPAAMVKGITSRSRREQERFSEYGMPKEWADDFYKEASNASKERMKSGGDVYKKVDPDMNYMVKHGKAKRVDDKRKAEKIESYKKNVQHLAKVVKGNKAKKGPK